MLIADKLVFADDRQKYLEHFSAKNLLHQYHENNTRLQLEYRRLDKESQYIRVCGIPHLIKPNDDGDIMGINYITNYDEVTMKGNEICDILRGSYEQRNKKVFISAGVGASIYPIHGKMLEQLYVNADIALYNVKNHGKDGFCLYKTKKMEE